MHVSQCNWCRWGCLKKVTTSKLTCVPWKNKSKKSRRNLGEQIDKCGPWGICGWASWRREICRRILEAEQESVQQRGGRSPIEDKQHAPWETGDEVWRKMTELSEEAKEESRYHVGETSLSLQNPSGTTHQSSHGFKALWGVSTMVPQPDRYTYTGQPV